MDDNLMRTLGKMESTLASIDKKQDDLSAEIKEMREVHEENRKAIRDNLEGINALNTWKNSVKGDIELSAETVAKIRFLTNTAKVLGVGVILSILKHVSDFFNLL